MEAPKYLYKRTFGEVFAAQVSDRSSGFEHLMDLHDESFVGAAYKLLLRRDPDQLGMRYYTGRLRRGYSRISLLDQLVRSAEVRSDWREITGLGEQVDRYRRSRTLAGWRLALFDLELGRGRGHYQARIIQNELGAQRRLLAQATEQLAAEWEGSQRLGENGGRGESLAQREDRKPVYRFHPPRPRAIVDARDVDLPDHIQAAVRLLDL